MLLTHTAFPQKIRKPVYRFRVTLNNLTKHSLALHAARLFGEIRYLDSPIMTGRVYVIGQDHQKHYARRAM